MSKTAVVEVDGQWFWVYDVCRALLFAEIVRLAESRAHGQPNLSADKLYELKVLAIVGDFACIINDGWSSGERELLASLVEEACARLILRPEVSDEEGRAWTVLDDQPIAWRGRPEPTRPIVEFGMGLLQLLRNTHPAPPGSLQWFYGFPGGRTAR